MTRVLPVNLVDNLRSLNPWWRGQPGSPLPAFRRWPFARLQNLLVHGMTPASVLRGPRRVGKTVLLRQLIESFIAEAVNPQRILYIAFDELPTLRDLDEPVLAIARPDVQVFFPCRSPDKPPVRQSEA